MSDPPKEPRRSPFGRRNDEDEDEDGVSPKLSAWLSGFFAWPQHPQTVVLDPSAYSWWTATGSSFVADKFSATLQVIPAGATGVSQLTNMPVPNSSDKKTNVLPAPSATPSSSTVPPTVPTGPEKNSIITSSSTATNIKTTSLPPPSESVPATTTTIATETSSSSMSKNSTPAGNSPDLPSTTARTDSSKLAPTPTINNAFTKTSNKTIPIAVGVVVPLVLIILGVVAFILYKRRQRARDRREWERTHEAIADAVRQVGAPVAAALPAWNPARGDVKEPLDGDTAPLFDKSGGSPPGSLGHSRTDLLSHSRAPSSLI